MLTPAQLENCNRLIVLLEKTPEDAIDLDVVSTECGTCHCSVGWAATDPYFNKLGISLYKTQYLKLSQDLTGYVEGQFPWSWEVLRTIFGEPEDGSIYNDLFAEFDKGTWDYEIEEAYFQEDETAYRIPEKQLAIERIKYHIRRHESIAP